MESLAFDKYEGLGNDFVVVDAGGGEAVDIDIARRWCDRRRGIGADGVLVMSSPRTPQAMARMRVINADGSIAAMCGNGLRCAVLHLARASNLDKGTVVIETDAGARSSTFERVGDEAIVVAEMGVVAVHEDVDVVVDGRSFALTRVDAGNPHAVAFLETSDQEFDHFGPLLSRATAFPGGANVEFARPEGDRIHVRVWERGAGATLACGTGACAVHAAAEARGLAGDTVTIVLPGGELFVRRDRATGATTLRGPARHVFAGRVTRA